MAWVNRQGTPGGEGPASRVASSLPAVAGCRIGTVADLLEFVAARPRWMVLTGAGVSTDSGIPDYRGPDGRWKHSRPVMYQDFVGSDGTRRRYWGRSVIGWRRVGAAHPNDAHHALAVLEARGRVHHLVTQNVDGLHQRAGSRNVTDLHGRLDSIECLACGAQIDRDTFQGRLESMNPGWDYAVERMRPDGDVELAADYSRFAIPGCADCGGVLKPSVVFFGENVPKSRVAYAMDRLAESDGLLVVGSSLMVFSGYRFVREARRAGKPVAVVNLGRTRADHEVDLKVEMACGIALDALIDALA